MLLLGTVHLFVTCVSTNVSLRGSCWVVMRAPTITLPHETHGVEEVTRRPYERSQAEASHAARPSFVEGIASCIAESKCAALVCVEEDGSDNEARGKTSGRHDAGVDDVLPI